jgi:chromosomal replication initiation ATPase DnaA
MKLNIFNSYAKQCAFLFGITEELLFTKYKKRDVVDARQLLYFMCKNREMKIVKIQAYMSSRGYVTDHTTIIYGISQVQKKVRKDPDYKQVINSIDTWIII